MLPPLRTSALLCPKGIACVADPQERPNSRALSSPGLQLATFGIALRLESSRGGRRGEVDKLIGGDHGHGGRRHPPHGHRLELRQRWRKPRGRQRPRHQRPLSYVMRRARWIPSRWRIRPNHRGAGGRARPRAWFKSPSDPQVLCQVHRSSPNRARSRAWAHRVPSSTSAAALGDVPHPACLGSSANIGGTVGCSRDVVAGGPDWVCAFSLRDDADLHFRRPRFQQPIV